MLSNDCINDSQKSINSIMWRPHRSLRWNKQKMCWAERKLWKFYDNLRHSRERAKQENTKVTKHKQASISTGWRLGIDGRRSVCSPANSILDICLTDLAAVELSAQIFKHRKTSKNLSNFDRMIIDGFSVQRVMLQWGFGKVFSRKKFWSLTTIMKYFPNFNWQHSTPCVSRLNR